MYAFWSTMQAEAPSAQTPIGVLDRQFGHIVAHKDFLQLLAPWVRPF